MKRAFYSDPLSAAWMSKHFGMKFEGEIFSLEPGALNFINDGSYEFFASYLREMSDYIYIHPESLALLEPEVGDVALMKNGLPVKVDADYLSDRKFLERTILRNAIAFIWPEFEDA